MAAEGFLLVDKPSAWTSHDVVAKVRGLAGTRKVGHSGTLDPDGDGTEIGPRAVETEVVTTTFTAHLPSFQ